MKKIIIYYFSGTGNTWYAAKILNENLKISGHKSEYHSIEQITTNMVTEQIKSADHLIIGFPVYGSAAPQPMREFIEKLPESTNKMPLSVFATHAMGSGDSAFHLGALIVQKGYNLTQTRHFVMMNNFHIPKFRFIPPKNDHRLDKSLEKVRPKIEALAQEISKDHRHIIGNNPLGHMLGNLQRKHIDRIIGNLSRAFTIDKQICLNCSKCVFFCPTQNINKKEGTYQFGNNCALCLRCYSQCPSSAILIGKGSADTKKYPRYKGPGKDFNVSLLTGKK